MKNDTIDITVEEKKYWRSGYTGGIVMILLGCLFMARNYGFPFPDNWWAFFVLIPAVPYLAKSWALLSRGELRGALAAFVPGLLFCLLSAALLLDLDWSHIWPLFLIFGGVASLLSASARVSR